MYCFVFTFNDESNRLLILKEEAETTSGRDYIPVALRPDHFGFRESLEFEFQHGGSTAADLSVRQVHGDCWSFRLTQQMVHGSLNGQFGAAGDFAAAGGRHASVESSVFRFDVLENQCQSVGFVLVSDFESLLGIVSGAVLVPLELGFLTGGQKALVGQQTENFVFSCQRKQ